MSSQTSPKAQAVAAVLILAVSFGLYLFSKDQPQDTTSEDLSQALGKKLPPSKWQISEQPEVPQKPEPYNQFQKQIQDLKQIVVEPLNNLLGNNKKDNQLSEEGLLLNSILEPETQENTGENKTIYGVVVNTPTECYREGPPGPIGKNVIAPCCNCGERGHDCDYTEDCGDPSSCTSCADFGCLNKFCPGKPAIWDPVSKECGC